VRRLLPEILQPNEPEHNFLAAHDEKDWAFTASYLSHVNAGTILVLRGQEILAPPRITKFPGLDRS